MRDGRVRSDVYNQAPVDAHAALRGSFHWRDLEKPLQVVRRRVAVHLERQDLRDAPAHESERALEALMAAERARGFDLAIAPVMRWSVLRLGESSHRLLWSFHHLLLDGWSLQLVLGEVFARYDALRRKVRFAAPAPRPYGEYIGWLQGQDPRAAEAFWRRSLAGFRWPTRLGLCVNAVAEPATAEVMDAEVWRVPADATAAVLARAREWKVTPNALVLAAWTLLLARYADEREVVVGAVSSGRPPELSGVESMVGAFANTLPLRVPVDPDARVLPWLGDVQARQLQALEYQWSSLVEIQGWSEVPRGTPLFESLFVFQNAPGTAAPRTFGGVALRDVRFNERTHLPLTLEAWLGDGLTLTLFYDRRRFACDSVRNALQQLATVIEAIPRDPDARLRDLPLLDAEARRRVLVENALAVYGERLLRSHAAIVGCGALGSLQAMALALARGISRQNSQCRAGIGQWHYSDVAPLQRLRGRVFAIIGLGRIGTATALRAKALGMDVAFYDPYLPDGCDKALGVRRAESLAELLRQAYILSVHCPLTDETRRLIDSRALSLLPHGSYLVNTARGAIVDTSAIPAAIASGQLAGAVLDVLPHEPPPLDDPLITAWRDPNHPAHHRLIVNPHSAFYTEQGFLDMRTKGATAVRRALTGQPLRNVVN
jgi:lactate dehydrogenase-like 2-hydroxyacid dehydrogenase